jgi:hypothetical protein
MRAHLLLLLALALAVACGDKDDTGSSGYEGDQAGECSDGADNDRDGLYDCEDPDCMASPDCDEPDTGDTTEVEGDAAGECDDGDDNDGDGLTDCDDPGCDDDEACDEPTEVEGDEAGECDDGVDNDGDGATDCDDPGCDADDACENQAPGSPGVLLTPAEPTTDDDLECTIAVEATDPDGDTLSYSISWLVDGSVVHSGTETAWGSARTAKGQVIQCLAYASDGQDVGDPGSSEQITVVNSAPTVVEASISPAEPIAGDLLECTWSGYSDPDFDDDASTVAWTIDGVAAGSGAVLATTIAGGQGITCAVTAYDGEDEGNTVTATVTVGNSPPAISSVWLTPTDADVLSTLTCTPGTTTDADGDTISFDYAWAVDGLVISHSDSTLTLDLSYEGAQVQCSATPDDGTASGTAVSSNLVTIQAGPVMELDLASWDFGLLDVGCEDSTTLTISNTGTSDLLLSGASIVGDPELGHDITTPAVIAAGGSQSWTLDFVPSDMATYTATLSVASNDPRGDATVDLTGRGSWLSYADGHTAEIEAETAMADIIIAVDRSGSMSDDIIGMTDGLPGLTGALLDAGVDYQIAATVEDDGCVNGSDIWIDDTFSDTDATTTFEDQVNLGGSYGSNTERAFMLLEANLDETVSGGCNEGLLREGASLHLVGLSDEPEQSVNSYSHYLSLYEGYVDSADLLYVHAIGGDYPSGCGGATAYTGMYEATVATGGAFLSICTSDWTDTMTQLGEAMVLEVTEDATFSLSAEPVDSTLLTVTVEGVDVSGSWTYDASTNSVTIDSGVLEDGDAVVIAYDGYGC